MGLLFSGLTKEDITEIQRKGCGFTPAEIEEFYKRFRELDKEEIGRVYMNRLLCIPEISINPIGERVLRHFCGESGSLDFRGFLRALSMFSTRTSNEEKLAFFIEVLSPSKVVSVQDLEEIADELYAGMYTKQEVQEAVKEVFSKYDTESKGTIEHADLKKLDCSSIGIF
ncbi:serine/threonine-protein phosphatase 2B regulatory subunit [Nematocida sp. AWRm77]|nr:serine/threonine-protein phosphatase 2B regulatory subunit [Nematocida sp. AWRm77]